MRGHSENTAFLELTRRQMLFGNNKPRDFFGDGREFFFVQSPFVLQELHRALPPVTRVFEEVIGEQTAHRFHMDIECEIDHECMNRRGNGDAWSVESLREYLFLFFIPFLTRIFNDEWGINCSASDWLVLNASLSGKKYSMHLFLASVFFCESRIKSWIVAAILKAHCDSEAETNEAFASWYYINSAKKTVIDWSIYSKGKRNFRIIGSCKPMTKTASQRNNREILDTHYREMRPLLPDPPETAQRPWTDFIATVTLTEESVRFPPPTEAQKLLIQRLVVNGSRSFSGLCGILNIFAPHVTRSRNNNNNNDPDAPQDEGERRRNAFRHLFDCIQLTDASKLTWIKTRFLRFLDNLHPGNPLTEVDISGEDDVLFKYRLPVFMQGEYRLDGRRQRLCYLSYDDYINPVTREAQDRPCVSGDHMVVVTLKADLSIVYYCFACKNTKTIVPSPIVRDVLVIEPKGVEIPFLFEQGFVDYDEEQQKESPFYEFDQDESGAKQRRYMKDIEPLPASSYHHDIREKRTIVLHGGMGVGKSTVIKRFLERVQSNVFELYNRNARIICVSFRTMLAKALANSFGLQYYKDDAMPTNLSLVERIAVQLDSLGRIIGENEIKAYDVVIIDESESLIHHLSSKTLNYKRRSVFTLLRLLSEKAVTVIAADADMGIRSRYFLQETRKRRCVYMDGREGVEIPNVLYARNRYVSNEMEYVDYMSFATWLDKLFYLLVVEQKHVFVCANAKEKLHMFVGHIIKRAEERLKTLMEKNLMLTAEFIKLHEMLENREKRIIVLDADIDGKRKAEMAEKCNELWSTAFLLCITPVVGAGLSFDTVHFDQAFVYGCRGSSPPRALLQLLGRVRTLRENKVHIYLDVLKDTDEDYTIADAQQRISRRVQNSLSYDDVVTDTIMDTEDQNSGLTVTRFIRPDPDRLLTHMIALNLQEADQGEQKYRSELIKVLSENNPFLYYRFAFENPKCLFRDSERNIEIEEHKISKKRRRTQLLSEQRSLDRNELSMAKRRDSRGVLVSDDPEEQKNAKILIESNDIRHTFGFTANMPTEISSLIYSFFSEPGRLEQLTSMAQLLFSDPITLRGANRAQHTYTVTNVNLEGERTTSEDVVTFAREVDFLLERKAALIQRLLYYAGFTLCEPFTPSEKPFCAHTTEMAKRLAEPGAVDWFTEHWSDICDILEIKKKLPVFESKELRVLCRVLAKSVFKQVFGLVMGKNQVCSRGHCLNGSRNKCQEWGASAEDTKMYTILIGCYLRNEGASWARSAYEHFNRLVVTPTSSAILDMANPYSDALTTVTEYGGAAAGNHNNGEEEEGREEGREEEGVEEGEGEENKKKFRVKFDDFKSMWEKIQQEMVFSDQRVFNDPFSCFSFFTNTTIQQRWKQHLIATLSSMDKKRVRLVDQNNWERNNGNQQFSSFGSSQSLNADDWMETNSSTNSLSSLMDNNAF